MAVRVASWVAWTSSAADASLADMWSVQGSMVIAFRTPSAFLTDSTQQALIWAANGSVQLMTVGTTGQSFLTAFGENTAFTNTLANDTWYYLAATFANANNGGRDSIRLYDATGSLLASNSKVETSTSSVTVSSQGLWHGQTSGFRFSRCVLYDVALSDEELDAIVAAGVRPAATAPAMWGEYIDEGNAYIYFPRRGERHAADFITGATAEATSPTLSYPYWVQRHDAQEAAAAPGVTGVGGLIVPLPVVVGAGAGVLTGAGGSVVPVPGVAGAGAGVLTGVGGVDVPVPGVAGGDAVLAVVAWYDGISSGDIPSGVDWDEISGMATPLNAANSGHLWTISDGPNPFLQAIRKSDAADGGKHTLSGATVTDVEDVETATVGGQNYVYLADTGDNPNSRATFRILRVEEPDIVHGVDATVDAADFITITCEYPSGNIPTHKDAEGLIVDPADGTIYVITKRETIPSVYSLAHQATYTGTQTMVYEGEMFDIPDAVSVVTGNVVGATISEDGREIFVKNYENVYHFARGSGQSIFQALNNTPTVLPSYTGGGINTSSPNAEYQGESVCFDQDGQGYWTTSERVTGAGTPQLMQYARAPGVPSTTQMRDGESPTVGYAGTEDTYVWDASPTTVRGSESTIVSDNNASDQRVGLIKFDISSIPFGDTIIGAYVDLEVAVEGEGWALHRMLIDWDENSTYDSLSGGVSFDDVDSVALADCENGVSLVGYTGPTRNNVPVATVQGWLDGTTDNFGWAIRPTHASNGQQHASRQNATVSIRPRLVIRHMSLAVDGTASITAPTPGIAGVGVGGVVSLGGADIPVPGIAGVGVISGFVSGLGGSTAPTPGIAGVGLGGGVGAATATVPVPGIAGAGSIQGSVSGLGTPTVPVPDVVGAGVGGVVSSGGVVIPVPDVAAAGEIVGLTVGVGGMTVPVPGVVGAGVGGAVGGVAATVPVPDITAAGVGSTSGAGVATVPVPGVRGFGGLISVGVGVTVIPPPEIQISGSLSNVQGDGVALVALPALSGAGSLGHVGALRAGVVLPVLTGAGVSTQPAFGGALLDPIADIIDALDLTPFAGALQIERRGVPVQSATGTFYPPTPAVYTYSPWVAHILSGRDLQQLPAVERETEVVQFYVRVSSGQSLLPPVGGGVADVVRYQGRRYRVITAQNHLAIGRVWILLAGLIRP